MEHRLTNSIERGEHQPPAVLRCRACFAVVLSGSVCGRCGGVLEDTGAEPVGEVVAVTTVARVPDDVVLRPPYEVALVCLAGRFESLAIADVSEDLRVGDSVVLDSDHLVHDEEVISYVRLRRRPAAVLGDAP